MLTEIELSQFADTGPLFHGHPQHLPVQAIIDGNYPGRVFVDNPDTPTAALVWAMGKWSYLGGAERLRDLDQMVRETVESTIIPTSQEIKQGWFELYTVYTQHWMRVAKNALLPWSGQRHFEAVFTWDEARYRHFRQTYEHPSDIRIEMQDLPLLDHRVSSQLDPSWCGKTTPAARVLAGEKLLSFCRSNGLEANEKFMIEIETPDSEERHKGYAIAAAVTLLDHCLEHHLDPFWETTTNNGPSVRLARKLGFEKVESYPVWAIEF